MYASSMAYQRIATKTHGIFDYCVSIALILMPVLFGLGPSEGMAAAVPMILGTVLFLYSVFTYYELGIIKLIGMPSHLVIDAVAAVFLAISPLLFGFISDAANAWLPHILVGVVWLLVAVFTKTAPAGTATPVR